MTARTGEGVLAQAPPALAELLEAIDREGIPWSLLRPAASVTAPEGDFDVLVAPERSGAVERLLAARGFALMAMPGPDTHGVAYDADAGRFVWVHVQRDLRVAGAVVPAAPVLAEAVVETGVRRPGDGWLLWILLLRALVDKGRLAERHRPAVAELAARWEGGPEVLERLARQRGLDPRAVAAVAAAGDWDGLARLSVHRPPAPPSLARRLVRRVRALRGRRARRGISVALLGPDGAGKSSLAAALARDLPLPTRVQYQGLTGGKLPRADALRIPGLVFAARVGVLWLRYARGLRQMARGGIVVFDRYTLDAVAPPGMRQRPLARLSRRVQMHVLPKPDLVLLLDASGGTLHARSGEYDPEVLESWRVAFTRLEGRVPALAKLDAERPADEVRRQAAAVVWRRYGDLRGRRPA